MKRNKTDNRPESETNNELKKHNADNERNQSDSAPRYNVFWVRTIIIVVMIVILLGLIYACIYTYLNRFQFEHSGEELTPEEIANFEAYQASQDALYYTEDELDGLEDITLDAIPEANIAEAADMSSDLKYILLIGIDTKSATDFEKASTDVMKVLVIDEENNTLKLVSLMRDILVPIEGHFEVDGNQKYGKLNSVYYFNGPDGLCDSIKNVFQIPVDDYIIINWPGVVDMVNAMGGVDIDVKSSELAAINQAIREQNKLRTIEYTSQLYKNGMQTLNGNEALAYCRVRKCGNGDFDRVNRQVVVLQALFASIKDASFDEILALLDVLQNVVKTNIGPNDLLKYTELGYGMLDAEMTSLSVPVGGENETYQAGKYMGRYVLRLDFVANKIAIHDFIGDDIEIVEAAPIP